MARTKKTNRKSSDIPSRASLCNFRGRARPKAQTLKEMKWDLQQIQKDLNMTLQVLKEKEADAKERDLIKQGKIKIIPCTFVEWYLNEDSDTLWIYTADDSDPQIYVVLGEEELRDEDARHWKEYKLNYFRSGEPISKESDDEREDKLQSICRTDISSL